MSKKPPSIDRATLLVVASIIAIGGIIYELMLSTATSYLIGDSTKSYSLGVGLSLFGMGIGSLLVPKLYKRPLKHFMSTELALSVLGGTSIIILYTAFNFTSLYWLVFVILTILIGILIGFEIPLVVQAYNKLKKDQSVFLSRILAADYIGALAGSLLFPFVLLPHVGLIRSAIIMGLINLAAVILLLVRSGRTMRSMFPVGTVVVLTILTSLLLFANTIERELTTKQYRDEVVFYKTTQYQKIIMTKRQDDVRLYLNNQLQFSSRDEARYHETLVHSAMTRSQDVSRVLILGGGDGLVAREVLKYPEVQSIVNVDIDSGMTDVAKSNPALVQLNNDAFANSKVQIINQDAQQYIRNISQKFDVVIVDLVDPANEKVARLFSTDFYREVAAVMRPGGVFITQATSTYFTPQAFWMIHNNVAQVFGVATPLNVNVPSFGEWGFVMSAAPSDRTNRPLPKSLQYLTINEARDVLILPPEVVSGRHADVSTILSPKLHLVYNDDFSRWSYQ